uniref:Uncharacterized protein n=1 Tax=Manihot esculenta TaxID=3983 RepID=A0A2C9VS09_MANES
MYGIVLLLTKKSKTLRLRPMGERIKSFNILKYKINKHLEYFFFQNMELFSFYYKIIGLFGKNFKLNLF